jgi:hypothetical protein
MLGWLPFNRTQSRTVTGLPTGHNTLIRHLCQCETLASLRHVYLGSFFLEPEDVKSIRLGTIWNFSKVTGLPCIGMGHKRPLQLRPRCIGAAKTRPQFQSINQYIHTSKPITLMICYSIILKTRNISDKSFRENQNTHFTSNNFFPPKFVPFMRYCGKICYSQTDHR